MYEIGERVTKTSDHGDAADCEYDGAALEFLVESDYSYDEAVANLVMLNLARTATETVEILERIWDSVLDARRRGRHLACFGEVV